MMTPTLMNLAPLPAASDAPAAPAAANDTPFADTLAASRAARSAEGAPAQAAQAGSSPDQPTTARKAGETRNGTPNDDGQVPEETATAENPARLLELMASQLGRGGQAANAGEAVSDTALPALPADPQADAKDDASDDVLAGAAAAALLTPLAATANTPSSADTGEIDPAAGDALSSAKRGRTPLAIATAPRETMAEKPGTSSDKADPNPAKAGERASAAPLAAALTASMNDRFAAPTANTLGDGAGVPSPSVPAAVPANAHTAAPTQVETAAMPAGLRLASEDWNQAFGQHVLRLARGSQQQAEIVLHPRELGQINIQLAINEQRQAQIHFVSAHAPVREAVEAALPQLRQALAAGGLTLGQASVGDHGSQAQFAGGDAPPRREPGAQAASAGASTGSSNEPAARTLQRVLAPGRIDIFA